ncbi:PHB depolymerase family esterase [Caballeronia sp. AZ10_KS36]|uniref:extracellular catalytic domain type 1 short-chain-length polyhydroxyalkanoate depolymerase n=1 Tax=Caballeronia sp. AZ10_KS36 TaxID=2921757 RepID=UPI0020287064|nr:PHB depolymerase family esterase [Caballeronia sp. AZ10_KS36]
MKLNEGFLDSMKEAFQRFQNGNSDAATDIVKRAMRGDTAHANPAAHESRPSRLAELFKTPTRADPQQDVEDRGHFSTRRYANAAGQREYKLYVPSAYGDEPLPLVVMLHGCTQNADDFAAGTQMNTLAERQPCIVAYPIQPQTANASKCWNWFKPSDQQRDAGEPALIAGITREIIATHNVDVKRVYVAGLSAGGAMAAVMAQRYPDLYAAAGVHSGLPAGRAHDLPSALALMRGGEGKSASSSAVRCPLIVFHGDADATVNHVNARRVVEGFRTSGPERRVSGAPGTREHSVQQFVSPDGVPAELWTLHGAPHAWSGGSARGTYTDPSGPDASAEMLRFFFEHPRE